MKSPIKMNGLIKKFSYEINGKKVFTFIQESNIELEVDEKSSKDGVEINIRVKMKKT